MVMAAFDHVFFFSMRATGSGGAAPVAKNLCWHIILVLGVMQSQHGHLAQERGMFNEILKADLETLLLKKPGKLSQIKYITTEVKEGGVQLEGGLVGRLFSFWVDGGRGGAAGEDLVPRAR
jgi:hypothetical protein